jgi:ABC-2 type transport system ATP-binding protein
MIEIRDLTKTFGRTPALQGVDLDVPEGACFGLLGPNGAGKSTLMGVISGIFAADGGTVQIGGSPADSRSPSARHELGLVPQNIALYPTLDALENLRIFGGLHGLGRRVIRERGERLLQAVGLWERRHDAVKVYSGGMRRRLNIITSLLHEPRLLLCDEPTVGVDPQSREAIFGFLEDQWANGLTILYSTHYMEEAERLCDRIAIIDHGVIIAAGTRAELLARLDERPLVRLRRDQASARIVAETTEEGYAWADDERGYLASLPAEARLSDLYRRLEDNGIGYAQIELRPPTIEQLFLHLTGRSLRE